MNKETIINMFIVIIGVGAVVALGLMALKGVLDENRQGTGGSIEIRTPAEP